MMQWLLYFMIANLVLNIFNIGEDIVCWYMNRPRARSWYHPIIMLYNALIAAFIAFLVYWS